MSVPGRGVKGWLEQELSSVQVEDVDERPATGAGAGIGYSSSFKWKKKRDMAVQDLQKGSWQPHHAIVSCACAVGSEMK